MRPPPGSLRLFLLVVYLIPLAACDDIGPESAVPTDPVTPEADVTADSLAEGIAPHDRLAKMIAASMADERVRSSVLKAMQASRVHEHKLILQRFLGRSAGSVFRAKATEEAGAADVELGQLLAALPTKMDFYMPDPGDRREWTGTSDVSVAAILDPDTAERATAFMPKGEAVTITSPEEAPGAIFLIHPAEPHVPGGPRAGENTVEVSSNVASSEARIRTDQNDLPTSTGGSGGTPGTWISAVSINFGDGGWGNAEIYFETCDTNGQNCEDTEDDEISVPGGGQWFGDLHLHSARADDLPLVAQMWEADSFLNNDDDFKGNTCLALDAGAACIQEFIDGAAPYLSLKGASEITGEYVVYLN